MDTTLTDIIGSNRKSFGTFAECSVLSKTETYISYFVKMKNGSYVIFHFESNNRYSYHNSSSRPIVFSRKNNTIDKFKKNKMINGKISEKDLPKVKKLITKLMLRK